MTQPLLRELHPTTRLVRRHRLNRLIWAISLTLCVLIVLSAVVSSTPTGGPDWLDMTLCVSILGVSWLATRKGAQK